MNLNINELDGGEMLQALERMESSEEVISFGKKVLDILVRDSTSKIQCHENVNHGSSFIFARVCNLLGFACLDLHMYVDCLRYLKWAEKKLIKLKEEEEPCNGKCVLRTLLSTQNQLITVKIAMGKKDEVVIHLKEILEIKEKMNNEDYIEFAEANKNVFEAYMTLRDFEKALPFCLKVLAIHTNHLDHDLMEIARVLRRIALIYYGLGEYEKGLNHIETSLLILMKEAPNSSDFLKAKIEKSKILIRLKRFKDAIYLLKKVNSCPQIGGFEQVSAFVSIACAFCFKKSNNFDAARGYLEKAQLILDNGNICPLLASSIFEDMSLLYEKMYEFGKAASFLSRYLLTPEIPQNLLFGGCEKLFTLISLADFDVKEVGFLCLKQIVEKLEENFGSNCMQVGDGYFTLGAVCRKLEQHEQAVKFMERSKDIMDISLGPCHLESLRTSQDLALLYSTLKRYYRAVEVQEKVVDGFLNGLIPKNQILLDQAVSFLNMMKQGTLISTCQP